MLIEADRSLYLRFFKILSGFSTGKARSGSGLLLVYLFLLEARIFPVEPLKILVDSPGEKYNLLVSDCCSPSTIKSKLYVVLRGDTFYFRSPTMAPGC